MRALVFLLVFAGLAFVGYRYWNPESPAEASAGPEEAQVRIEGGLPEQDFAAAPGEAGGRTRGGAQAARVQALLTGDYADWIGKPLDARAEGDTPELRYAGAVSLAAGPRGNRTGLSMAASALCSAPERTAALRAAGFEQLGSVGRWEAAAEATGGRNDALLEARGRRGVEKLLSACRSSELAPEDACLWTSAVLDVFTAGEPYLESPADRDLFARLYQAQQDALAGSLMRRSGAWRSRSYKVKPGEWLGKVSQQLGKELGVPMSPGLLMLINGIRDARRVQAGQLLRVPTDEMHVLVERDTHTLKLFLGPLILRVYPVGLGAADEETPAETFKVTKRLKDPSWTNPKTKVYYPPGAPGNALGGFFIALAEPTGVTQGYGIHGTDDQASIGRNESMGCIRMRKGDIDELFELLALGTKVRVR